MSGSLFVQNLVSRDVEDDLDRRYGHGTRLVTDHVAKDGTPKIVSECDLPLTGVGVVDSTISDRAVFDVVDGALVLHQIAPGHTFEQLRKQTRSEFTVALELAAGDAAVIGQADTPQTVSVAVGADA